MARSLTSIIALLGLALAGTSTAQLSPPNAAGVAMGHVHYIVRDVAANKAFWVALGGKPIVFNGTTEGALFPDVVVLLRQGEPNGGSEGSVVNHVAFRVQSFETLARAGFTIGRQNPQIPGIISLHTPEGERIELFEDGTATNVGFTIDGGGSDAAADRHNRSIDAPIVAHHIHLYVPEDQVAAAERVVRVPLRRRTRRTLALSSRGLARHQHQHLERAERAGSHQRAHARSHRVRGAESRGVLPQARSRGHQVRSAVQQAAVGLRSRFPHGSLGHHDRADRGPSRPLTARRPGLSRPHSTPKTSSTLPGMLTVPP